MSIELTNEEKAKALASAPSPITIKDRTFLIEKTSTSQVFSIYEWAIERAIKGYNPFKEVCAALDGLPITDFQKSELLMQAHRVKMSGEVPSDSITKALRSKEGIAFQLWILARKQQPGLTLEDCGTLIDEDNRIDVYVALDEASGANIINKSLISAGFFPPAPPLNTGSLDIADPA